jgi:hypothetical protein
MKITHLNPPHLYELDKPHLNELDKLKKGGLLSITLNGIC